MRMRAIVLGALALAASSVRAEGCLQLMAMPEARVLATLPRADAFAMTYVHSVTRTPVDEVYHLDGDRLLQTSIAFVNHGPGLPTEADAGQSWREMGGRFVVTTSRPFERIRMRVHRDQSPRLTVAGDSVDLAQWGNRSIELASTACRATSG
jgi:hypothetical protein